jgi:hypothetical protein
MVLRFYVEFLDVTYSRFGNIYHDKVTFGSMTLNCRRVTGSSFCNHLKLNSSVGSFEYVRNLYNCQLTSISL